MKKIFLVALCFSGAVAFGQTNEAVKKKENKPVVNTTEQADKKGKPENAGKPESAGKPENVGKPESLGKPENAGKPNNQGEAQSSGNAYGKDKGELTGREFGQQRAAEARAKHENVKPVNQQELERERIIIRERNIVILSEMDRKLNEARERLATLEREGKISKEVFTEKVKALENINERKINIELKVVD